MNLYDKIIKKEEKISLIGLGYVGMPIAVAFAKKADVIGFDINEEKIALYKSGTDPTKEVGDDIIKNTSVHFTSDENDLKKARFHIVAVPTPVNPDKTPDLSILISATEVLSHNLEKNSIVVYESTVYPGVTEDICVPILERGSGLICGIDFKVGYSPERINPGDKLHRIENVIKIVSGQDPETLDIVAKVYELVALSGVYRAESIKVAEAAKVIENSQRDINIAFMNELSIILNKLNIDTKAVLETAGTKWNFMKFHPGLVGGHCIGVDPYYLTYKAEQVGCRSKIILAGRIINDDMGKYVTENIIKSLIKADVSIKNARVAVLGITFKENCPDIRNSKVMDIIDELNEYGIQPLIYDPIADENDILYRCYDISDLKDLDCLIIAVPHKEFLGLKLSDFDSFFKKSPNNNKVIIDIKGILDRKETEGADYIYWRL